MGSVGASSRDSESQTDLSILVTGTNSGLGLSICRRLIDEFLSTRKQNQSLTLIFTTRSTKKSNETQAILKEHVHCKGIPDPERIKLRPEHVDLCDLASVRALSRRLLKNFDKLDVVVLNAGIGGWTGINWPYATYLILTDLIHAVTWPSEFCLSDVGRLVKKQTPFADEPPLGQLFCANVFGHYMLAHNIQPLLKKSQIPGRIIWTSSVEATCQVFNASDIQALKTRHAYEATKYLTDVLAITSSLPSTSPWVNAFLQSDGDLPSAEKPSNEESKLVSTRPNIYVSHPGVCATSIMPLMFPLHYAMLIVCFLARLLGSPWHVLFSYNGATTCTWLALASQSVIDAAEAAYSALGGGKVKWGTSSDRLGRISVVCTEVEGWGFGGVVGSPRVKDDATRRRKRGAKDLTAEERVEFEELGRKCWREMEELRIQWEEILDRAEKLNEDKLKALE